MLHIGRITLFAAILLGMSAGPALAADFSVGDPAPAFKLSDQSGKTHSLEDFRGKWLVLYFYPKDDTPGCTTEACEFRDNIFAFRKLNSEIVGISLDDESSHQEFAEKYSLPFPLLADVEGEAATAYGVLRNMVAFKVAKRETFLIDPAGNIAKHYEDVNPEAHSKEVLADIEQLAAQTTTQ